MAVEAGLSIGTENSKGIGIVSCIEDFHLTPEQEKRLNECLIDIAKSDPLEYRRKSLAADSSQMTRLVSLADLRSLADLQNILYEPGFTSHRRFLGHLIVRSKKLVHKFFNRWLGIVLARQFEFNQRMFNLALAVHVLENRVRHLESLDRDNL